MAEVRHMVDELDHETAGMDYGRRTVDVEERKDAVPKPANYVPRTREEKEELERARAIKRNAWGDPV